MGKDSKAEAAVAMADMICVWFKGVPEVLNELRRQAREPVARAWLADRLAATLRAEPRGQMIDWRKVADTVDSRVGWPLVADAIAARVPPEPPRPAGGRRRR